MSAAPQIPPLPALKNILFATDLAEDSQAAIPYIRAIAGEFGSTIHVLHVLSPEPMLEIPLDIPPELDADRRIALSKLKKLIVTKPFGDAKSTITVERGRMSDVLTRVVEGQAIDLIVVGTHGRRGLSKVLMGSVAEQIVRASPCPVLTVGPHCLEAQAYAVKLETIVFATDFSASAHHAVEYALSFAKAKHARLIFVHAVPRTVQVIPSGDELAGESMRIYDEIEAGELVRSRDEMARLIRSETMRGWQAEAIIESGTPAEVILAAALKKRADLIVMGAHHSATASHIPWATASTVACSAPCPVLTVRS